MTLDDDAELDSQPRTIEGAAASDALPSLEERVLRLRSVLADSGERTSPSDWGNFGNDWGQGGGFDKKTYFEKNT